MLRIFLYLFIVIKCVFVDLIYFDAICIAVVLAHLFLKLIFPRFYFEGREHFFPSYIIFVETNAFTYVAYFKYVLNAELIK